MADQARRSCCHVRTLKSQRAQQQYPIQKVTEIYDKVTEMYNKFSEHAISSWNVLSLLRSEVAYIGTGHILP